MILVTELMQDLVLAKVEIIQRYLSTSPASSLSSGYDPTAPPAFDTAIYYLVGTDNTSPSSYNTDDADERAAKEEAKRQAVRDEIDYRTGRLWTDHRDITEDEWVSGKKLDDLREWSRKLCSRKISLPTDRAILALDPDDHDAKQDAFDDLFQKVHDAVDGEDLYRGCYGCSLISRFW